MSNGDAGVAPSSSTGFVTADVISADLIWPAVQAGWAARSSADTPAEWGAAMDVPAMAWNSSPGGPPNVSTGSGDFPARIWTPGATTSGFTKLPAGPREEKAAS